MLRMSFTASCERISRPFKFQPFSLFTDLIFSFFLFFFYFDMVHPWMCREGPSILCLGLIRRPFNQDYVFPWNLAYVPFGHDGFLAWDSFSQP
jgi:hypothetical protein